MSSSGSQTGLPDKRYLYGVFERWNESRLKWQEDLSKRAAHKSLDIPLDEDVNINANRFGIGWKELLVAGAVGLGATWLLRAPSQAAKETPAPVKQPAAADADTRYRLRFGE